MAVLAVAAVSARMMAEAAVRDGFEVVALDVFGDADTRRIASAFLPIGAPHSLHIDAARVLAALAALAVRGEVAGWVAGSGFEGQPELLTEGARLLPLIGTAADAVRRVRDPTLFFDFLAAHHIAHPQVQAARPADTTGWLMKDANGCGGWHIRRAARRGSAAEHHYFQREVAGVPMSATFIANGVDAVLLGFNELIVHPVADRPFVYCGVVGPVSVPDAVARQVRSAVRSIAAEFALRGLCSLDFMLTAAQINVLEINPRPPASMALYAGVMRMHVRACLNGELPGPRHVSLLVNGHQIVFAGRPFLLEEWAATSLADAPDVHDLPAAGVRFQAGDPVCSVSASGADAAQTKSVLDQRCQQLLRTLENNP